MKIGKFTIEKQGWYYNNRLLATPLEILQSVVFFIPYYIALTVACLCCAGYKRDWWYAKEMWYENA